jgi:hypothetical protein
MSQGVVDTFSMLIAGGDDNAITIHDVHVVVNGVTEAIDESLKYLSFKHSRPRCIVHPLSPSFERRVCPMDTKKGPHGAALRIQQRWIYCIARRPTAF